jgi:hypothetical protein
MKRDIFYNETNYTNLGASYRNMMQIKKANILGSMLNTVNQIHVVFSGAGNSCEQTSAFF